MNLFRIKICGITRPEDAVAAADCGADAIGLNFFPGSSRFLDDHRAAEVCKVIPAAVAKVGVFVNATADEIRAKVDLFQIDWVQLHGDEPPEMIAELQGIKVVRALRVGAAATEYLATLADRSDSAKLPAALLLDAYSPAAFGGTGQTIDWSSFPSLREQAGGLPMILAGGLTGENVAQAIRIARPDAVDTASGVEESPGLKDHVKLRNFVEAARVSFAASDASRSRIA